MSPLIPAQRTNRPARRRVDGNAVAVAPAGVGGDVVPLSQRILLLAVLRIAFAVLLGLAAYTTGRLTTAEQVVAPLTYVVGAGLAGALLVLVPRRQAAVAGFGLLLCADAVALEAAGHVLGASLPTDLLTGAFLAAVCLLASFRTGVKLAGWQSIVLVVEDRGVGTGLFPAAPGVTGSHLAFDLAQIWVLVLVVCVAASVNERELRRRRYDAEVLQAFSAQLNQDDDAATVLSRTVRFVDHELDAVRIVAVTWHDGALRLLEGVGAPGSVAPWAQRSPLLDLATRAGTSALILALDRARDPWLDHLLPGARRLVVLPLTSRGDEDPVWILFEHAGRGVRVERRLVATAGQAAATASLALSRALLFDAARRSAMTDGLTGLYNRAVFDQRMQALTLDPSPGNVALVLIDVDHFKAVNDNHGHQAGDEVLRVVGRLLRELSPAGALPARFGGEEFAVVLAGEDAAHAEVLAESLRTAVQRLGGPVPVTASFGVAVSGGRATSAPDLIRAADEALYRAKSGGRNRVEAARVPEVRHNGR